MPNYCCYEMKIQGEKENVMEFIDILKADYNIDENGCDCDRHFWRVFDANLIDYNFENGENYALVCGYCAWSVYCCMCDGVSTYNSYYPDLGGTTLQEESKKLNLTIEIFSEESGCEFMEHFVFINGDWIVNQCVDYQAYDTTSFENVDELNEEYGTNFTQEEFDADEFITVGGMPWIYDCYNGA